MKKRIRGIISLLIICVFVAGAFSACGNKSEDNNTSGDKTATDTADLSGSITMAGSTSMEKLANAAAEGFMTKYPNVVISPEFTGSGAGLEALTAGTIQIGNSSRSLTDDEKAAGAVENIVCLDGIAVIVDSANTVTNLTKDQLSKAFTGAVKNWKDFGGADQPIVIVGRESGSGTRDAFEELVGVKDACKYSNEINSTGGVLAKVASTPGAIGYVSLDVLDDSVKAINIDSVEPTVDNIKAGTYLLQRPFVMATKGEITKQDKLVQAFFEYLKSDEGKKLIESLGLINLD
jgi:phosphate transport system substrate-binding protein